jgi:predicted XRE-type DNA-binding protein
VSELASSKISRMTADLLTKDLNRMGCEVAVKMGASRAKSID